MLCQFHQSYRWIPVLCQKKSCQTAHGHHAQHQLPKLQALETQGQSPFCPWRERSYCLKVECCCQKNWRTQLKGRVSAEPRGWRKGNASDRSISHRSLSLGSFLGILCWCSKTLRQSFMPPFLLCPTNLEEADDLNMLA